MSVTTTRTLDPTDTECKFSGWRFDMTVVITMDMKTAGMLARASQLMELKAG